jgi:hypothetical protein
MFCSQLKTIVRIESIGVKTFKEHKGIYMSSINTISLTNNNNNDLTSAQNTRIKPCISLCFLKSTGYWDDPHC